MTSLAATVMQFKEALERLRKHPEFVAWEIENPEHYLAHGFLMRGGSFVEEWQIGFYNKKEDRIVVFTIGENVTKNPPSELFKKESGVKPLDIASVSTDAKEALDAAEKYRQEHFKAHVPQQTIVLLQHLQAGQVWNITFITEKFTVVNIKLDTTDLSVKSATCESLMGWGEAVKGERKR